MGRGQANLRDYFASILGEKRGSDRDVLAFERFPYLVYPRYDKTRKYLPDDSLVERCDQCGAGERLAVGTRLIRDWNDKDLPALCLDCYEDNNGIPYASSFELCCEEWCSEEWPDHPGLCRP